MSPGAEVARILNQSRADRFVGIDRTAGAARKHQDPDRARVRPRRTPRHSSANRDPRRLSATKQPLWQRLVTGAIVRRDALVRHLSATAIFAGSIPARHGGQNHWHGRWSPATLRRASGSPQGPCFTNPYREAPVSPARMGSCCLT